MIEQKPHPAKFSEGIVDIIAEELYKMDVDGPVVDPFAGTGGIHDLHDVYGHETYGIELEPEWAEAHPRNICGDSRQLKALLKEQQIAPAVIATSVSYGNRMADNYAGDAKGSKRYTYRVFLGRKLTEGNSASMQWGKKYRKFHDEFWQEAYEILSEHKDGKHNRGIIFVNVSNHIRSGEEVQVVKFHRDSLKSAGFQILSTKDLITRRMRHGANYDRRPDSEKLLIGRV